MLDQKNEIKETLRQSILRNLDKHGVSQGDLALILGVDRRVINRQLNAGFEHTSVDQLIRMVNALDVSISIELKKP